jgi:hypothetical protein
LLKGRGRQRPNLKDLPQIVTKTFSSFKYHALSALGDLDPWDALPDDGLEGLWNALAGDAYHISSTDDHGVEASQRFHVIKKLVHFLFSSDNIVSNY